VALDEFHPAAWFVLKCWNGLSRWQRWAAGSFVFCETAAFRELGGFSLELFASEEIEFSERLKALARRRGRRLKILHRHPLVTSARKMRLYSAWEHLRVVARAVLTRGGSLKSRDAVPLWYDGRR
jgi:GT2 family glycosyltransferase